MYLFGRGLAIWWRLLVREAEAPLGAEDLHARVEDAADQDLMFYVRGNIIISIINNLMSN